MSPKKTLIIGCQRSARPCAERRVPGLGPGRHGGRRRLTVLDLTDAAAVAAWPWHEYALVLNAAAYTAVDAAETPEGRRIVVGGERRCAGHAGPAGRGAPLHPGALLLGVRLRRHRRAAHRGRAALAARGLRPDEGRGRHRRRTGAAALPAADLVGDRRRQRTSCGRCRRSPATASPPTVVDDQTGRLTFTGELSARHAAPAGRAARRTAPTT